MRAVKAFSFCGRSDNADGVLCYGYKVVKKFDVNGEPIRGDREIVPEEAEIIPRIFREFASGLRIVNDGLWNATRACQKQKSEIFDPILLTRLKAA